MSEILLILRREFLERVRTRAFVISTILFPVLLSAGFVVPTMVGSGGGEQRIAVVNEGPAAVGAQLATALNAASQPGKGPTYTVEQVPGTLTANRDRLNARVQSKELDGYVWIPADVLTSSRATYRARNVSNLQVVGDVQRAVTQAVRAARIQSSGMDVGQAASLLRPVDVNTAQLNDGGEEGGNSLATLIFGYVVTYLVFFMIMFYGQNVMRSVVEEKTNRIVEVIVSSVRATDLMLGKILGVSAVALLQVSIWAAFVAVLAARSDIISKRFGIPPGSFKVVSIAPGVALALVGFFLLGFLLYAALYAAVGAAVTSEQEAQQLVFVVFMPLMIGFLSFMRVAADPLGSVATTMGMIPFTAPVVMPLRITTATIPAAQVAGSLALMALTVAVVTWLAGKVYRVGILSTGKKPSLRELAHWLRAA